MYITNPNRRRRLLNNERINQTPPEEPLEELPPTPSPQMQTPEAPEPQQPTPMSPTEPAETPPMSGTGYLVVRVTTASGAIPLEDALVTVKEYSQDNDEIITVKKTNSSGLTEKISLPAPSKNISLGAGRGKAYSTYYIEVLKDNYIPQHYINVPIFDGVTAIQNADMIPYPENGQSDRYAPYAGDFYESENPDLDTSQKEEE